ncbi:MAG: alpha/beta hydrolase family protein [Pseudobdellovibrionaceae bacterium]
MVGTLAIGKPGVEFFKSWDPNDYFYDKELYLKLEWQDLINNVSDAIDFASTLPCVDSKNIVILGHSEGTQIAVNFANLFPTRVRSLILIGYAGENLAKIVDWQLFHRDIDSWLMPDVDTDHDGCISKSEAQKWPELHWNWKTGQDKISFLEIEAALRADPDRQKFYQQASTSKIWKEVFNRAPLYEETANLNQNIFVFTGELDIQTRPEEALELQKSCIAKQKTNCEIHIVPNLGHGMSQPKGPRKQKLVDATLGPADDSFLKLLKEVSEKL